VVPGYGGLIGEGDFDAVGAEFLMHFRDLAALEPTDRVLDVGCGLGRMTAPLTGYLTRGTYHGFDVMEPAIRSCQRRFRAYPSFNFDHVDVFNGKYNPRGRISPTEFRFPYPDEEFDFAFAISVFTHMQAADVERYLEETARVLRPGGRFVATWFVMTPEAGRRVERAESDLGFPFRDGEVWHADPREPEVAIAYSLRAVRGRYRIAGLELEEPVRSGTWSGTTGLSYQDIVVSRRPRSSRADRGRP